MFVSDLRHFFDIPDEAPGPAKAMAAHLFAIVQAATAATADEVWLSALTCRRRPSNRLCRGYIAVARHTDGPIEWRCERCGDEGVISGWENSPYDLRHFAPAPTGDVPMRSFRVTDETAVALRDLQLLDIAYQRMVFALRGSDSGPWLTATADDLDELLGYVAAEANHEPNARRRKRLDEAFGDLQRALDSVPDDDSGPTHLPTSGIDVTGRWRIVEMELWDQEAMDLVQPAFIEFDADGTGDFGFIAVRGSIDWRAENGRIELSWEGFDEGDQSSGRGWAVTTAEGALEGRIYFHHGDDSAYRATRPLRVLRG